VRDFLGALVDQEDDDLDLGMVLRQRDRDFLQQRGLAGLGRRGDQAALALADRRDQLERAHRHHVGRGLELKALGRIDRDLLLELLQEIGERDVAPFARARGA
jgi:hypothetical protein